MNDLVPPQLGTIQDWQLNFSNGLVTITGVLNSQPYTTNRLTLVLLNFNSNTGAYDSGGTAADDLGTYQLGTPL